MRTTKIISTTALFLLLGIATPAIAAQEKPEKQEEKAKPAQKEQQAKPEQRQKQANAPKQEQAKPEKQQEAKAPGRQSSAKPEKQQQANAPKQEQSRPQKQQQAATSKQEQAKPGKQQPREQQAKYAPPQRSQEEVSRQRAQPAIRLSVRTNVRIPDDRFRSNFGSDHHFHIGNPVLVGGYSRFQYGGFWFGFVQPWPSGWYYTDDVYIDYVDGGYYMFNPYYPGVRFSISVVS